MDMDVGRRGARRSKAAEEAERVREGEELHESVSTRMSWSSGSRRRRGRESDMEERKQGVARMRGSGWWMPPWEAGKENWRAVPEESGAAVMAVWGRCRQAVKAVVRSDCSSAAKVVESDGG